MLTTALNPVFPDGNPYMTNFKYRTRANRARTRIQRAPLKNMLIFSFYFIFKLKFHQKKGLEIIQDARSNGAPTVDISVLQ